ncbi:J domain-containing protein [Paenibacillus sp. NPDC058071]|uniref:J domain-containing protein n=1 Tax=Paenibacillus sp. NPDC058071 TaxID=3346326 RepID=UPI0036D794E0
MDELQQAYRTLGLPDSASKEEVEKRYSLLLRQARARQKQAESGERSEGEDAFDFDSITRAYRFILAHEDKQAAEQFNQQEYGKYKKMAGTAEKVDHFWRYYKFHVFGGIVLVALIIYGITAFIDHREEQKRLASLPPVDLEIMFLGEYFISDGNGGTGKEAELEEALLAQFPDWNRFTVKLIYAPMDVKDQMDIASQQKAMVMLATEKPDVYILDKGTFNWISPQGPFLNLDEAGQNAGEKLKEALGTDAAFKQKTEDDTESRTYGIEISGSKLLNNLPVVAKDNYIVAIRVNSERQQKALEFIERFLETK